ncbi:putative repeat protein (TIGR01451 family) [Paenibacillus cellulosilyticus]|uniref:Putative repeat protein (TIGR01451 family) n=1 Tax=Paenibacillus cellulosilyticus TaxID=375489 RepID=A0A2V2YV13_9BACL|nr:hypothetical protein [Paenibacillus cellulosilyticus]PWW05133.1 putative repeat protein (TIGR01451 family) [Paenibacillus cellulosilyticus]QKS46641.1 hypothetical protein HUB94_31245 [Paenibacillus cellulosilyticus]
MNITVNPTIVQPGGEVLVTVKVQNVAAIPIVKQFRHVLPTGFEFVVGSLHVSDRPHLTHLHDVLDLGTNQPGQIDTILFRLRAPLIPLVERTILSTTLTSSLGDITNHTIITIEEGEE